MENQLNSGSLETLKFGETLLVSARKVKNDKIHLEFAEIINNQSAVNVLGLLNKSDDAFSSRARRAWVTAEPADATEFFGCDFGPTAAWYMSEKGEMLDLNILNPTMNDVRCRIKIEESIEGTDWQNENIKTAAKRKGKDGDFITHLGAYIFSNTSVVLSETDVQHVMLEPDTVTAATPVGQAQESAVEELNTLM
tara:strand:+ start:2386 stop:2970 length:585 start_codon:yes stop_codon:yes gene_type:complete